LNSVDAAGPAKLEGRGRAGRLDVLINNAGHLLRVRGNPGPRELTARTTLLAT